MSKEASNEAPLLEISTLSPKRPYVLLDDERFDLKLLNEFGAAEHADFSRDSREYDSLWNANKRTVADNKRMEALLNRLFDRALMEPKRARDLLGERLTAPIKREVVLTFSNAPLLMEAMARMNETQEKPEDRSTTES